MRNAMNQLETYERESSRNGIETIEEAVPFGLDETSPIQVVWGGKSGERVSPIYDPTYPRPGRNMAPCCWNTKRAAQINNGIAKRRALKSAFAAARKLGVPMFLVLDERNHEVARFYV